MPEVDDPKNQGYDAAAMEARFYELLGEAGGSVDPCEVRDWAQEITSGNTERVPLNYCYEAVMALAKELGVD